MKTVLLLGAGASVAEARAIGVSEIDLPPTDKTFIRYMQNHSGDNYHSLYNYAKKKLGIEFDVINVSMEDVFNKIYFTSEDTLEDNLLDRKMFAGLVRILFESIAISTGKIASTSGPLYKIINQLLNRSELKDFSIVTFNYDLLVEKTLEFFKSDYLNLYSSYSLEGENIVPSLSDNYFPAKMGKESVSVLKLHGSLNWFREWDYKEQRPIETQVDEDKIHLYSGPEELNEFKLLIPDNGKDRFALMLPVVVPPIYDKIKYYNQVLKPVWSKSKALFRNVQRIIFFGYCLPEADIKAQILLSSAIYNSDNTPEIHIINTDPSVCEHFAKKLPIKSLCYYRTVDEFINQNKN